MVFSVLYLFICLLVLFTVIKLFWGYQLFWVTLKTLTPQPTRGALGTWQENQGQMQWSPPPPTGKGQRGKELLSCTDDLLPLNIVMLNTIAEKQRYSCFKKPSSNTRVSRTKHVQHHIYGIVSWWRIIWKTFVNLSITSITNGGFCVCYKWKAMKFHKCFSHPSDYSKSFIYSSPPYILFPARLGNTRCRGDVTGK
jgi:hypothetical protein